MSSEPIVHYAQETSTISAISSSVPSVPSADQPIRAMIAAMVSGFISLINAATWQNHRFCMGKTIRTISSFKLVH